MTDERTVDVSAEAVADIVASLREEPAMGMVLEVANLLEALSASLTVKDKLLASRPFQPTADQAMGRVEHSCKINELEEQRDSALADLAKMREVLENLVIHFGMGWEVDEWLEKAARALGFPTPPKENGE